VSPDNGASGNGATSGSDAAIAARVWAHDADFWKPGDEDAGAVIRNRLGWLTVPELMLGRLPELTSFADGLKRDGFRHVVVMGMGGSSLCPIVLAMTYGAREGYPQLLVLDSTSPEAVRRIESHIDLATTLFIESSKSGTTLEPRCFGAYFWAKLTETLGTVQAAQRFACITDPGTPLEVQARERGYRGVFVNPQDIGGRYSALSYFGMLPGACVGVDVATLLTRGVAMAAACGASGSDDTANPGVMLGRSLASNAHDQGRACDKITFITSPSIAGMGLWLEQLIAESTGKEGKGLIPVAGEPLGAPDVYGDDRHFVALTVAGDTSNDAGLDALEKAGRLVTRIALRDTLDLGAEFFRWEFATAVAGALLGINSFDEPNVKESKDNTNRILAEHATATPSDHVKPDNVAALSALLAQVQPGDYIDIPAFVCNKGKRDDTITNMRVQMRAAFKVATTAGFGPRFLHSTGQLHKGGPNTGVFIQLVGDDPGPPLPIPNQPFDFGTLIRAQALGDLQSLETHGRRVISVDLGSDIDGGLATFNKTITAACAARGSKK
jgi:glucose-6-phosphate isomerase